MAISMEKIRTTINDNSLVVSAAAVVVIAALLYFVLRQSGVVGGNTYTPPTKAFFYDEDTGETVVRSAKDIPPCDNGKGKMTLVKAYYYTYGTDDEKKLAYLEKYTDQARAVLEKANASGGEIDPMNIGVVETGQYVRAPEAGSRWVQMRSGPGEEIMRRVGAGGGDPAKLRMVAPK